MYLSGCKAYGDQNYCDFRVNVALAFTLLIEPQTMLCCLVIIVIHLSTWLLLCDSTLILLNMIPTHNEWLDLETRLVLTVTGFYSIYELHVWHLVGWTVVASCHLEVSYRTPSGTLSSPSSNTELS